MTPSHIAPKKISNVVLAGNPNAGKTSLFNHFTGLQQKVGNYPGVTIDRKVGKCDLGDGIKISVTDLPGTYSFYPNSIDERIALQTLLNSSENDKPDVVIYVADVTQLERHLLLFSQIADLNVPLIFAVNMLDIAESEGITCNLEWLEKELSVPVVGVNGRTGEGINTIKEILKARTFKSADKPFMEVPQIAQEAISVVKKTMAEEIEDYPALLVAHHYSWLPGISEEEKIKLAQALQKPLFNSIRAQVEETMQRYNRIVAVIEKVLKKKKEEKLTFTDKLDKILTHPILGIGVFLMILFLLFQAIFAWASYPMDLIDAGFAKLVSVLKNNLPNHLLTNLLTEGIIAGLGGIIIFVPQITILFCLVAVLEDVGYMSRAVFLSDNVMRRFGLNGRSIVSLISGVACAIPAIMATRTISNWKERMITIFVTPLMSCSARIPVFTVLIAFIVPEETVAGIFNLQGIAMTGLYLLGGFSALISAWVMKHILKQKESSIFMMELPTYKMPHWKNIFYTVLSKVKVFVFEAGKVIIIISVVLWFLASYGPGNGMEEAQEITNTELLNKNLGEEERQNIVAAQQLEASYAGKLGKAIEPVIQPLGFDWKIGIALITSFAAREVFVGTMATIYSVGESDEPEPLIQKLKGMKNPITGDAVYNVATSLSLLFFYLFAMQCMSTIAVVYRETKGWKWPLIQLIYMTGLAYVVSLITYQLLS